MAECGKLFTGSTTEPPDWVAIYRVKHGIPVGRDLFRSERVALLEWADAEGIDQGELASRVIKPDGSRLTGDAVSKWRTRQQERQQAS